MHNTYQENYDRAHRFVGHGTGLTQKYINEWSDPRLGVRAAWYVNWDAHSQRSLKQNMKHLNMVIPEFFSLPQDDKMYRFSRLAIGPVVANSEGGINYCDIPYSDSIQQFSADYRSICSKAAAMCENICLDKEMMVIGTSAMIETELDCIVNQYAKGFNNPMVMWGRYHEAIVPSLSHSWFRTTLAVSFQFHHVQLY